MAEFKLLGGTDAALTSLGKMTQGLGFPLHDVESSTSGGPVTIISENVLESSNFTDQGPTLIGVAYQVLFGGVSATPQWSMDAAGAATCLEADEYTIRLRTVVGRTGGAGEAQIYQRVLINGAQVGSSSQVIVDNDRIEIPLFYNQTISFNVNDVLTFEIIRDTDGNNSGGLTAGNPDVVGWNPGPSASLSLSRTRAVES